ncbi:MAG: DUF1592 domain-containing protein [Polyangiaceae bacterium]
MGRAHRYWRIPVLSSVVRWTLIGGLGLGLGACDDEPDTIKPPGPDTEGLCETGDLPGPRPRLVRLTHSQYDASVSDLLEIEGLTPSKDFIDDPVFAGFDNSADGLVVSERLAHDYQRAAEALADLLADPTLLAPVVPCDVSLGDEACATDFIRDFGRRVYRRPLTTDESAAYLALYGRGDGKFASGTPFEQGIRHVIEAFLQSPNFLYRVELSEELDSDKLIPLTGFEIATRLSYLLWNSTPDDALLDAAASGALDTPEGVESAARRLLADPRAKGPIDDFHAQWLQLARYDNVQKDASVYPGFDASTDAAMKEETQRFIRHVAFELEGGFRELMLSRTTFVNDKLAPYYGLSGTFGPDFVEVELDPTQRAGLLTQVGFLASHAYTVGSSPIHRGVFVQRRVLCTTIGDPPGNVDTTLPPFDENIKTTKQAVEAHTSPAGCTGCHSIINAPGYALENFDGVGAYRTTENGEPVDPTGTFKIDGESVAVDGPIDLVNQIAESESGGACYMRQWYRYAFARQESDADECTMGVLEEKLASGGYNIGEMLVAFTQTKTFRFRIAEEITP